jgi:hypothetical protein
MGREPIMPDRAETLVRWYLRFNGYLAVENFVVHEPRDGRVDQGMECDILAVRFPHSREDVGAPLPIDEALVPQVDGRPVIDFVIAEVKGGNRAQLNSVWTTPSTPDKVRRVAYLLRWLGPFERDDTITYLATELQSEHRAVREGHRFRLVFFSRRHRRRIHHLGIQQITFGQIANFLVNVRVDCWRRYGLGVRSDHSQWDPLILEAWRLADPGRPVASVQKVRDVLALVSPSP